MLYCLPSGYSEKGQELSEALHDRFMCRKCFNECICQNPERIGGIFYTLDVCASLKGFILGSLFTIT